MPNAMSFLIRARRWAVRDITDAIERQTAGIELRGLEDQVIALQYRGKEVKFFIPDGDHDRIQKRILLTRTFYEEPILSFLNENMGLKGRRVVDVGANMGNHTVFFGVVSEVTSCLSFEPAPRAFSTLSKNIEINGLSNVARASSAALSDAASTLTIGEYYADNQGMTSFVEDENGSTHSTTLDDVVGDVGIDFLKIDVEGMAIKVLKGARGCLQTHKPNVLVELIKGEFEEADTLLRSHGYRIRKSFSGGNHLYEATVGTA